MIEIFKGIDLILVGSSWIRWALVFVAIAFVGLTIERGFVIRGKNYEISELQKNLAKVAADLHVQNQAVEQLGKESNAQKKAYESAVNKATKIALELQSAIDRIDEINLVGSCDDKVKQAINYLKLKP